MAQHQVLRETESGQIIKQIALVSRWLVEVFMRRLTTARTQQANRCRAAVRGGRVKIFKLNIEVRPQWVRH